jgi:hypothetical protein
MRCLKKPKSNVLQRCADIVRRMRCGVSARRLWVAECCYVNLVVKVVLGMGPGGRARGELNNRSISTLKIASVPLMCDTGVGAFRFRSLSSEERMCRRRDDTSRWDGLWACRLDKKRPRLGWHA